MLPQSRKISEDVDHGLNDLIKVLNNPYKETFENLVEVKPFNKNVTELFEDNTGNGATLIIDSLVQHYFYRK